MNYKGKIKPQTSTLSEESNTGSVLSLATGVMQDLQQEKRACEIINNRLKGDSQLFKMLSLFLYGNKWLTRQNERTEKGKVWLEMVSHSDLCILQR